MSKQQSALKESVPWVIITVFKEDANADDLQRISPQVQNLIGEWHSQGRIMWSGAFNDNATGMAVFEATKQEAEEFYQKYDKICSGMLEYSMYQWDAMPILALLSK